MDPAALSIFPFQGMADRMEKDPVLLATSLPEFFLGATPQGQSPLWMMISGF